MQISDTVYPMYKAYIEPDLKTAHLKIYNTFNPFSGFMDPTYILKSARKVSKETIHSLLKVHVISTAYWLARHCLFALLTAVVLVLTDFLAAHWPLMIAADSTLMWHCMYLATGICFPNLVKQCSRLSRGMCYQSCCSRVQ